MLKTFISKTALSKVEYWYTLAVIAVIYGITMAIVTTLADNVNYIWGAVAGLLAISIFLLALFAKPSMNGLGLSIISTICLVFGTIIVLFGSGDYIPGQEVVERSREELCSLAFNSFGVVLPILLVVLTLLMPFFFEKEMKKQKQQ